MFYETLDALLTYTNRELGVIRPGRITMRSRHATDLAEGARVLDALWGHRELVGQFVRENPMGLEADHLACALPWRHAVAGMFASVDVYADHTIYLCQDRLFAVRPILGKPAEPISTPTLMKLVLLPFDGRIVTDGRTTQVSSLLVPSGAQQIATSLMKASRQPLIETAAQLITFSKQVIHG